MRTPHTGIVQSRLRGQLREKVSLDASSWGPSLGSKKRPGSNVITLIGVAVLMLSSANAWACSDGKITVIGDGSDWCPSDAGTVSSAGGDLTVSGGGAAFDPLEVQAIGTSWNLTVSNSSTFSNTSSITLDQFADDVLVEDRLAADQLFIKTERGDDLITVSGSIGGVDAGAGDDILTLTENGMIDQNIELGTGVDQVTIDSLGYVVGDVIFTGNTGAGDTLTHSGLIDGDITFANTDDQLVLLNQGNRMAKFGGLANGFLGNDSLVLDGENTAPSTANINLDSVLSFESLKKTGSGTWHISATGAQTFSNDLSVEEGTLIASDMEFMDTRLTNDGIFGSENGTSVLFNSAGLGVEIENLSNGDLAATLTTSDFDDVLFNEGTVSGHIRMGAGNDTFANSAELTGIVDLGSGQDRAWVLNDSLSGLLDGGSDFDTVSLGGAGGELIGLNNGNANIINFEDVDVQNGAWSILDAGEIRNLRLFGGQLTLNSDIVLTGSAAINSGKLIVLEEARAAGGFLIGNNGILDLRGKLVGDVDNFGDLFVGGEGLIDRVDVAGDFIARDGSRLLIDIDDSINLADRIDIQGDLLIEDGAELALASIGGDTQSVEHTILTTGGTIDGSFTTTNTGAVTYEVDVHDDSRIVLTLNVNFADKDNTDTENQEETAEGIQNSFDVGQLDADLADAIVDVAAQDYGAAMDELNGESYHSQLASHRQINRVFDINTLDRLGDREICGTLSGRAEENCRNKESTTADIWAQAIYLNTSYDHDKSSFTSATNSGGGIIGADTRLGDLILGGFGGYAYTTNQATLKQRDPALGAANDMSAHSVSGGLYGRVPVVLANLDVGATATHSMATSQRNIQIIGTEGSNDSFTETVGSSYASQNISATAALGQEYRTASGLEFEPKAYARADWLLAGGLLEEAIAPATSCAACLDINWADNVEYSVGAEIELRQHLPSSSSAALTPYIGAHMNQVIAKPDLKLTHAFAQNPQSTFNIMGYSNPLNAGGRVGIDLDTGSGVMGFVEYRLDWLNNDFGHQVNAGARVTF